MSEPAQDRLKADITTVTLFTVNAASSIVWVPNKYQYRLTPKAVTVIVHIHRAIPAIL